MRTIENRGSGKKVLVAGDIMLDVYHFGSVKRISRETPVPVLSQRESETKYIPGGAANAAVNMAAAGAEVDIFSVVGADEDGKILTRCLQKYGVGIEYVTAVENRRTTTKLRYIGQNNHQLLKVDLADGEPIHMDCIREKALLLERDIERYGLFLLSDYLNGFLTEEITRYFIDLADKAGISVLVDVRDRNFGKYRGAALLKPNREDLGRLTNRRVDTIEEAVEASVRLCGEMNCEYVLTTLGAEGMILTDSKGLLKKISASVREVYDVTGAGDTVIAYLAAEIMNGKDVPAAMETANYAAGIQVSKMGTSIVYPDEVKSAIRSWNSCFWKKQLNMYQSGGLAVVSAQKRAGRKIVFTNGCFDILHPGHVIYLQKAKEMGDILIVGVNSDASVRRIKGAERPVNSLADRTMLLSALESVDYVIPFEEDTPMDLIEMIEPDVLVKGGDYTPDAIVGAEFVRAIGGTVATIPFVEGKSSSNIIAKIRR